MLAPHVVVLAKSPGLVPPIVMLMMPIGVFWLLIRVTTLAVLVLWTVTLPRLRVGGVAVAAARMR